MISTEKALCEMIVEILDDSEVVVTKDTNLISDLGMDSISIIQLVVEIESKYDITLPDSYFTFENLSSLGSIVLMVDELILLKQHSSEN